MREIKFRAWDEYNKEMFDVKIISEENGFRNYRDLEDWTCYSKILMQFTGLYDKNNKPIYDGDIALLFNKEGDGGNLTFIVENDGLGFYLRQKNNMFIRTFFEIVEHDWQIEIIGNIHQNKDLLK